MPKTKDNGSNVIEQENVEVLGREDEQERLAKETQQEDSLFTSETVTSEPVVETVTDNKVTEDGFSNDVAKQLNDDYADGNIDETEILRRLDGGEITVDDYVGIVGETPDETRADLEKPKTTEDKPTNETEMRDTMNVISVELGKGKSPGEMIGWLQTQPISADTKARCLMYLREKENIANKNESKAKLNSEAMQSVGERYKPDMTNDDAIKLGTEIANKVVHQSVELEGSHSASMVRALATIAHGLLKGEIKDSGGNVIPFALSFKERQVYVDGVPKTEISCTAYRDLWNTIRKYEMFGPVQKQVNLVNKKELDLGTTFDPYNDKAIKPYVDLWCQKALLFAAGTKGNREIATFGYLRKSRTRPSRSDIFTRQVDEPNKYHQHLCAPFNVLCPWEVAVKEEVQRVLTNDGKEQKRYINVAVRDRENESDELRWIPDECVNPLFQHVFADWELGYDDKARGDSEGGGKRPSGWINRAWDKNVGEITRQRNNGETETPEAKLAKAQQELIKIRGENEALLTGLSMDNKVRAMQGLQGLFRNEKLPVDVAEICNGLQVSLEILQHRYKSLNSDGLKIAAQIMSTLETFMEPEPDNGRYKVSLGSRTTYVDFPK